jgi:peptidoglycan-associated lipoprotein
MRLETCFVVVLLFGGLVACSGSEHRLLPAAPVATAPACGDFSFPIYFDTNVAALSASARAVLASGAERTKGCAVSRIEVLGLADAAGSRTRNLALSRRRAAEVAGALQQLGLPTPAFDIEAMGEAGAKAPDGAAEMMRRRAEVVIHAEPRRP